MEQTRAWGHAHRMTVSPTLVSRPRNRPRTGEPPDALGASPAVPPSAMDEHGARPIKGRTQSALGFLNPPPPFGGPIARTTLREEGREEDPRREASRELGVIDHRSSERRPEHLFRRRGFHRYTPAPSSPHHHSAPPSTPR